MVNTKKFLSALAADGRARRSGPFVMPAPDGSAHFVELRTGKPHLTAYVVYTGVELTSDEVLSKASVAIAGHEEAYQVVESLLVALQQFKIGNVVAVASKNHPTVELRLVSNSPKPPPGPKLPG
jgi:hypothetical protein